MYSFWPEFLAIVVAHAVAVISPGPDFAVVTKTTLQYGRRTGIWTASGIATAILLHIVYAVLGFSLLISQHKIAFAIVKYLGALFLIYLGIRSLVTRATSQHINSQKNVSQKPLSPWKAWLTGFLTNVLNIKAVLFFVALFTAIVSTTTPITYQLIYGLWMAIATFVWFYFIAHVFGHYNAQRLFNRYTIWINRLMGFILIFLAVVLLLTKFGV